jgi:NAD(P)-dependent dehydrogenase (short-subunit alcohol dehydrogenase family)
MGDLRYDGRVAVVTGAGAGLGRCHALLLGARGASVVVNDVNADRAQETADEIVAAGGAAEVDTNSVSTSKGGAAIVDTAVSAFGKLDVVVNNAGFIRDRAFHNLSDEELDAVLDVHVRGAFNVTRPAWRLMRDAGYGRVLSTASAAGLWGNFGQANYSTAKAGLMGLTQTLAIEGAKYGINANVIAPVARTAMTEGLLGKLTEIADPALVSPAVAWLCHETCDATGHVYSVGGGRIARIVTAITPGYASRDEPLTPEAIRDHWELISAPNSSTPAFSMVDDFRAIRNAVR